MDTMDTWESNRMRAQERFRRVLGDINQREREASERKPFIATPEAFFELFLICLSWQSDMSRDSGNWTTVDKVARVLFLETIITRQQRKHLSTDKRVQAVFRRHAELLMHVDAGLVARSRSAIVISSGQDGLLHINPERMLRDCRIYLTQKGVEMAKELVPKYARVITRERYEKRLNEDEKFRQRYNRRHMGVVMSNYAAEVGRETSRGAADDDEENGGVRLKPARKGGKKPRKS